ITALLVVVAIVAGLIASIVGFGVGSLLTPTLSLETGIKLAVAAVAVPHMAGAAIRLWSLRGHVDRRASICSIAPSPSYSRLRWLRSGR
ncbi:MAG: hypothetical protein ACXWFJ_05100, partial [Candidatus Aminicenantales bacterium]